MRPAPLDEVCSGPGCASSATERCCDESRCQGCHDSHRAEDHDHCADCGRDMGPEPRKDVVCWECREERTGCAAEDAADARREGGW